MLSYFEWGLITLLVSAISVGYELILSGLLTRLAGDAIFWEAFSLGVFVAGLGLGLAWIHKKPHEDSQQSLKALVQLEFWLAIFGGLAPFLMQAWHLVYRVFFFTRPPWGEPPQPHHILSFGLPALLIILIVGALSGGELPLLIRMFSGLKNRSIALVLALYHGGAFVATVVFGVLGFPLLGPYYGGLALGTLNAAAALYLSFSIAERSFQNQAQRALVLVLAALFCLIFTVPKIEQIGLKNFYFNKPQLVLKPNIVDPVFEPQLKDWARLSQALSEKDDIKRWYGPYQVIDFVTSADRALYLDGRFQISRSSISNYHTGLVLPLVHHYVTQLERVLILGGGDGALADLIVAHPQIDEVIMVDIDPLMLKLAARWEGLESLNHSALKHPKLKLHIQDAFQALKDPELGLFDAIFVDFTFPFTYDSARFYGREFFGLLASHLSPDGSLSFATPLPYNEKEAHQLALPLGDEMLRSTLSRSGFQFAHLVKGESSNYLLAGLRPRESLPKIAEQWNLRDLHLASTSHSKANSILKPQFWGIPDAFL